MSKPWEQEWRTEGCSWVESRDDVTAIAQVKVSGSVEEQAVYSRFLAAAPDMARAGLDVVQGVLSGVAPVLGPISADEMVARGQSVTISASQFAALVASLRKAGVPL